MSRYSDWLSKQSINFVQEIQELSQISERFIDYKARPISLNELKSLDEKYCEDKNEVD